MRFPVEALPQALGGLLLGALIVVLLRVGGKRPENRALAAFFGATFVFNVGSFLYLAEPGAAIRDAAAATAGVAGTMDALLLARFAVVYLRPGSATRWTGRALPYVAGAIALGAFTLALREPGDGPFQVDNAASLLDACLDVTWVVVAAILCRSALRAPESEPWRSRLILGAALALLFASFDMISLVFVGDLMDRLAMGEGAFVSVARGIVNVARALMILALAAYLIVAGARLPSKRAAATAASVAIAAAGTAAVLEIGLAQADVTPRFLGVSLATAFLVESLLIAYALLRHQLLDIDLKIKLGLSRGTVAAIFLAVFFVVTQVAENYLQDFGVVAGGVAAGVMLFAIAPIQRMAERLADTAMPGVGGRRDPSSREVAYKHALRFALSDGGVTREEELHLAHLADELGLSSQTATRLRHEVEVEGSGAPSP